MKLFAKLVSAALCLVLLGGELGATPRASAAAPATLGTVRLAGDPDFDCDSIVNDEDSQWRWLSYPESRMVVNPGERPKYDGGMNLNATLFVKGMRQLSNLQKVQAGKTGEEVGDWSSLSTAWYPYKLTADAAYTGGMQLHMDEFFADKHTFVRLYDLSAADGQTLRMSVRNAEGLQEQADHSLLVETGEYWLVCRMLCLKEDTSVEAIAAPVLSEGDWRADFTFSEDRAKAAFSMTVLPKNVGDNTRQTAVALSDQAVSGKLSDKLAATKAYWDGKLGGVPAPTRWGIQGGLDPKGVTPEQHRRSFYAAWAFNYQNIIEPTPENGYPYYQVTLGKPSGYGAGPTGAPNSCEWESLFDIQQLALVEPEIAWSATEGFLNSIEESGKMPGESLPSQKAHTVWVCYQNLPDKERLAALYPKLRSYLLWRADNPHWGIGGRVYDDEKDISFVTQWYSDVGYAIEICKELGRYDDLVMWENQKAQMGEKARKWFFTPAEGDPADKIYNWYFADSGLHYQHDRTEDVENYICSALYADFPADLTERLIQHYVDFERPDEDLVGFDFYKYGDGYNVACGLFERGEVDSRLTGMWQRYINAAIRNVVKSVEFSEESRPNRYEPQGVKPSTFTASTVVAFTYMNNGLRIDLGRPAAIQDDGLTLTDDSRITLYTLKGAKPTLPKTVNVRKDGAQVQAYAAWEPVEESRFDTAGLVEVTGKVAGTDQKAKAAVWVYGGDVIIEPVTAHTLVSAPPENLPETLLAAYEADGQIQNCVVHIQWDAMKPSDFAAPGTVQVGGTISENGQRVTAAVTVHDRPVIESETGGFTLARQDTLRLSLKDGDGQPVQNATWSIKDAGNDDIAGVSQTGVLQAAKAGRVTVTATLKDIGISVEREIEITEQNAPSLAYGAKATASGQADAARGPEKAVDNDQSSMWRAANNESQQWFQLELPKAASITGLHIRWFEGNQPKAYAVLVSADGQSWTKVCVLEDHPSTHPNNYSQIIAFDKAQTARFVRLESTKAGANAVGIIELEVFGRPEIQVPVTQVNLTAETGVFRIEEKNQPLQLRTEVLPGNASDTRVAWTVTAPDGGPTKAASISSTGLLTPRRNGTVRVTAAAIDGSGCSASQDIVITNQDLSNLALGRPVEATTSGGGKNSPEAAVDGDRSTRWGSASGAPQIQDFTVDLGQSYELRRIALFFDSGAFPVDFTLQYSDDKAQWTDWTAVTGNDQSERSFSLRPAEARYVRIHSTRTTNAEWGFSIWEFEIYGRDEAGDTLKEALQTALDRAQAVDRENGTADSLARLDAAIDEARRLLEQGGASDEFRFAIEDLDEAVENLTISRPDVIPGDMDGNGAVTIQDVMEACKVLARQSAGKAPTADEMLRGNLDGDDKFTIGDVMEICKILARKA
ncbi:MAG: hypothetical protein HFE86_02495 [Clostridiales bacterium]|nr:hypothetical protein [Clostridiales bacterium]